MPMQSKPRRVRQPTIKRRLRPASARVALVRVLRLCTLYKWGARVGLIAPESRDISKGLPGVVCIRCLRIRARWGTPPAIVFILRCHCS